MKVFTILLKSVINEFDNTCIEKCLLFINKEINIRIMTIIHFLLVYVYMRGTTVSLVVTLETHLKMKGFTIAH